LDLAEALKILRGIVRQDPERPRAFHAGHVLLSMLTMDPLTSISRGDLQSRLGLGGGSIRSLITRLTLNHLVVASPSGMRLKGLGSEIKEAVSSRITGPVDVTLNYLRIDAVSAAWVVKRLALSKAEAVKLRDAVVRYGGTGGTTCLVKGKTISVPGVTENLGDKSQADAIALRKLKPSDGDAILITYAPSKAVAASAGAAALLELLLGARDW